MEGDIRDVSTVENAFAIVQPDIVFHMAVQPTVKARYNNPEITFDGTNFGMVNVLDAIRNCPSVKSAIVITSDKCHENVGWVWGYREDDPVAGHEPHSSSERTTENVCSAYLRSNFGKEGRGPNIGFAMVRADNVDSGKDWALSRDLSDYFQAFHRGKEIIIRSLNAISPCQHDLNSLSGYLFLAKRLAEDPTNYSGSWKFRHFSSNQINFSEFTAKFISTWKSCNDGISEEQNHFVVSCLRHSSDHFRVSLCKAMDEKNGSVKLKIIKTKKWCNNL